MSLPTSLVLESLILALDLFDSIQRNGKLADDALEAKIEQAKKLRKALVAEAISDEPFESSTPLVGQVPHQAESSDASDSVGESIFTSPSDTSSSELPADLGPYPGDQPELDEGPRFSGEDAAREAGEIEDDEAY